MLGTGFPKQCFSFFRDFVFKFFLFFSVFQFLKFLKVFLILVFALETKNYKLKKNGKLKIRNNLLESLLLKLLKLLQKKKSPEEETRTQTQALARTRTLTRQQTGHRDTKALDAAVAMVAASSCAERAPKAFFTTIIAHLRCKLLTFEFFLRKL